jgi:hypothetical protein
MKTAYLAVISLVELARHVVYADTAAAMAWQYDSGAVMDDIMALKEGRFLVIGH